MADGKSSDQLATQAAEAVRRVMAEAEERAAEIVREAETEAAKIRETAEADAARARGRAEADARAQIEAAKRALDELGGTLAAAATAAVPKAKAEPEKTEPVSPPTGEPEPEQAASSTGNGDDAAERLVAMKMAVDGKDAAAIEAELTEKFGARDRTELLKDVLSRVPR
jgi:dsDNA-specific endonuclease/ATPase MutS2